MKNPYQIVDTQTSAASSSRRIGPVRRIARKIFGDSTVGLGRKLVFVGVPIVAALLVVSVFATQIFIDSRDRSDIVFDKPEIDKLAELDYNRAAELTHEEAAVTEAPVVTTAPTAAAATPSPTPTVSEAPAASVDDPDEWLTEEDRYVSAAAHLRLGASTSRDSVGVLTLNEKVTRNGRTGEWTRVSTADGRTGFVFSEYLSVSPVEPEVESEAAPEAEPEMQEAAAAPAAEEAPAVREENTDTVKYVIPESARIRSGASTDYDQIGWIMRGYTVRILENLGNWSHVETESGLVGYISNDLLSDYYIEKAVGYVDTNETVYVNGDFVYIRAEASATSDAIATAVHNEALWRVATDGSWSRIQLSNQVGYIRNDLITTDVPETPYVPEAPAADDETPAADNDDSGYEAPASDDDFWAMGVTVYVNTAAARIRTAPSLDAVILGTGFYGEQLTQLSTNGVWSKIEQADGSVGYISNALISSAHPDEEENTTPAEDETDPPQEDESGDEFEARDRYVWVFVSGANIRSEASTSSSIVTTVGYGTRLTQTSSNGVWSTVYTPDGSYGYIMNSLFQLEEISEVTPDPEPDPGEGGDDEGGGSWDAYAETRQTIVNAAWSQIGMPYVWGGASPSVGFDCSGLVLYCYNVAGYGMGLHGSNSQARAYGWEIPYYAGDYSNLLPGDLLFWNSYGAPYSTNYTHVGIYVGGGQYIHAPDFGEFVRAESLSNARTPALVKRLY